ncbi:MAG TPA: hypothetical protein DCL44_11575 [Elusimicrobia bacterium]|nr:hypothetical protein [Elusimicrobiota bacterium]
MEKKNSIFAGLNPTPASSPVSGSVNPESEVKVPLRPPGPDPEVVALKQKMDAMEKDFKSALKSPATDPEVTALKQKMDVIEQNIVVQLEKRIREYLLAALPPQPPPGAPKPPDLAARIVELDKRLEEFVRSTMVTSAQMKHIEESKSGARRETEELLKVVREQQKYSEMDRQMHDQVEKAWTRVEELEKKLMDFYASSITRQSDERKIPQPVVLGAEVEKMLELRLQKLSHEIELKFKSIAAKMDETSPALARKSEERISSMVSNLDVRLAAFEGEFKKMHLNISSSEDTIQALYVDIRNEMLSALKNSMKEESEAVRKYVDGFVVDTEARMGAMSKLVIGHMDEMMVQTRQEGVRLEKMGSAMEINAGNSRAALSALVGEIQGILQKHAIDIGERIRIENAKNAGEIMEFSRLSAFSLASATAVAANMDELNVRLSQLRDNLKVFVDGMKDVKLESVLGVSGALVRKNFEGIQGVLNGMEQDLSAFNKIKRGITDNLKGLAGGGKL